MANKSHQTVTGFGELSAVLQQIPQDLREKVMKPAMVRAVQPVKVAAKRFAKRSEDTGALRASIDHKVVNYRKGAITVGMVGASTGYFKKGRKLGKNSNRRGANSPSKYSHLVEYGYYAVSPERGKTLRKGTARLAKRGRTWVPAKPFLRPAIETTKTQVANELVNSIGKGIENTRRRMVKAGTHTR